MSEESTDTEVTEMDDWAAAMAEQEASTEDSSTETPDETQSADPPAEVANEKNSGAETQAPVFEQFSNDGVLTGARNDIDMIMDIPVQLTVELGRTKLPIKNLLQLAQGSVVELDGMAGEPMDVLVNGCLLAQGEVVVVNDKFGIRLTDIITPSERIRKLNR
ncbi:MAG: flagellar motor switch protein FliN [Nitrosomonas sp.]|nr:flagellar motor switch protein FliN [Nitrosomonas sp.]